MAAAERSSCVTDQVKLHETPQLVTFSIQLENTESLSEKLTVHYGCGGKGGTCTKQLVASVKMVEEILSVIIWNLLLATMLENFMIFMRNA